MKGLDQAIDCDLGPIPCLLCLPYQQAPRGTLPGNSRLFLFGHKKATTRCSLTVPSHINQQNKERWVLRTPGKASSGLTSHAGVRSQSSDHLDRDVGYACIYQDPNVWLRVVCWQVPDSPGFDDLLGGLVGLSIQPHSRLQFITSKIQNKSRKRKRLH